MQCLYLRLRRNNPMTKKDVIATQKPDIPGYSSTNKRVYRKLYSKKYKSSLKLCFFRCLGIRSRVGLECCC